MKKRFLAAAAALMLAVCMLSGCGDNDNPPVEEITVSAGNSAVFTVSDKALYPIAREEPTADECIEKTVVITFSGATRVGLAIECENVLDGIMYSVNDGAATAFAAGTASGPSSRRKRAACWNLCSPTSSKAAKSNL